jgi:hypothetical protein
MTTAEKQIVGYFARYEPALAKLGKALRAKLRKRLPDLCEVVYLYENQNALVISYSPTENGYDGLFSLRLDPGGARLYFTQAALLSKADPGKLLKGAARVRYVAMESAADFDRAEIETLIAAALELAKVRPDANAKVIIRAEAQKQRATRAKKAAK